MSGYCQRGFLVDEMTGFQVDKKLSPETPSVYLIFLRIRWSRSLLNHIETCGSYFQCSQTLPHASRMGNTFMYLHPLTIYMSSGAVIKIAQVHRSRFSAFERILKIADW